jgi:hypothetical protein
MKVKLPLFNRSMTAKEMPDGRYLFLDLKRNRQQR